MKISNSKKQLAKIIHENGGWFDGAEFYCQDGDGEIFPYENRPTLPSRGRVWHYGGVISDGSIMRETPIKNWHQTILSRDEYFHLYPAPEPVGEAKPSIEQLAADYRNRKDYADRKQQEADDAKADADAKLAELVAEGEALGLDISIAKGDANA